MVLCQVLQVHSGDVAAEAKVLRQLGQHPRLVRFFGMCTADTSGGITWLVLEHAKLGSLDKVVEEYEDDMTPAHRLAMMQQICAGMEALAQTGLIHRDLALRNVLVFRCRCDDSHVNDRLFTTGRCTTSHRNFPVFSRPVVALQATENFLCYQCESLDGLKSECLFARRR